MIKVIKNTDDIPQSLIPALSSTFPTGRVPRTSRTTHNRRIELINNGSYIDHTNYNSRYKLGDITERLKLIYNGKCAFCEQKVEQLHVEHFRPKNIYYWLAYSWDNLILACPRCNEHKRMKFDINGTRSTFVNNETNIRNINNLSFGYDMSENPKMVNPEITDPSEIIIFSKDGKINSLDPNLKYTIKACQIERDYLNDARRTILDTLKSEIRSELVRSKNETEQRVAIRVLAEQFVRASKELSNEFIGFRRFSIKNGWIQDIVKAESK